MATELNELNGAETGADIEMADTSGIELTGGQEIEVMAQHNKSQTKMHQRGWGSRNKVVNH